MSSTLRRWPYARLVLIRHFLYSVDVPRRLEFAAVAAESDFHAALVQHYGGSGGSGPPHSHDFWEAMYVLEGHGEHLIGADLLPLQGGALLLIRPPDCHIIRANPGERLLFINVAFPAEAWRSFCSLAGLAGDYSRWRAATSPPYVTVPEADQRGCGDAFREALHAFSFGPTKLHLCRFWSELADRLASTDQPRWHGESQMPKWLRSALDAMELPDNLRGGLPRLRELSGVSSAYLARTFRRALRKSPTEFLNELRLRQAALLLRTTTLEIIDVAHECGFENLSYFYRLFRARYRCPPRRYRLRVGEQIVPRSSATGIRRG
jgi:AraC family cel operon transcriptional repressor